MLEQRNMASNLFTFGCGQLQSCLSQQKKAKFPFLQNAKVKKSPLLHKLVSEQRQKIFVDSENNNDLNLPLDLKRRGRAMSQGSRKVTFSLDKEFKQGESKRESSSQNRQRKKTSLPKVFKNIFPSVKQNSTTKKNPISAEPSLRYLGDEGSLELVQPFNLLENDKQQSTFREVRPKSVMFISENFFEIPQEKIKTIQHHRNRLYSKAYMSKGDPRMRAVGLNSKIIQNINQLKKIYC